MNSDVEAVLASSKMKLVKMRRESRQKFGGFLIFSFVLVLLASQVSGSSSSPEVDDGDAIEISNDPQAPNDVGILSRVIRAVVGSGLTHCPNRCKCEAADDKIGRINPLPIPTVVCSRQNLTRIPDGIPSNTKKLDLSWNNITRLPPQSLSHLYTIHELSFRGNQIEDEEEISALKNLTRLKELSLGYNKLSKVPSTDSLARSIELLDLEHNRITRVEGRVLVRNDRIRELKLSHNQIEEIVDDAFEGLSSLTILELNDNKLTGVPEALTRLPSLQELSLANNRITRIEIPFHERIPRIVLLQVRGNPIHFIHPDGFAHLHHLKKLILSDVKNLTEFPHLNGTNGLEVLRIDRCSLHDIPPELCTFTPNLKSLDLKSNFLRRLPTLDQCTELRVLDLGTNEIEEVEEGSLENLTQLHDLHLPRNRVGRIQADTFRGLSNLRNLDLSYNRIEHIDPQAFLHVRQLQDLNLGNNVFSTLPSAGLERLLDLKTFNNPNLREFPDRRSFPLVRRLTLSYAYHCCQFMGSYGHVRGGGYHLPSAGSGVGGSSSSMSGDSSADENMIQESIWYPTEQGFGNALDALNLSSFWPGIVNLSNRAELANDFWKTFETYIPPGSAGEEDSSAPDDIFSVKFRPPLPNEISCRPLPGPFLPCNDLFDWWTLRCGVWIVFLLALMGNGTVVFVLIFARTKMDVPRFLVCNLAVADFFMGVYLGFLAVIDAATLGEFRKFAIPWQLSSACQIAGFLGVLSSELSVFTLAVITMERHYAITHAMHLNKRLSLRHASYIMVVGWIFALIMAILPLFGISDYRKFAVCLPFETEDPVSLGYVVFLMFANGVAFTILMGCYLKMYCSIRGSQAWNSNDTRIAKRMALLVFTDLLCWFPIAFFSLTAIFGLQLVSLEEAKVFTVFILPLNSCCNPFLYAILTKQFKKDCVLICKAIEESRVTRGIGRCRHSSNFSNRQTAPNTGSLTEKSSKDGQPCICHSGLHPAGGDVNGNAKYRFIQSPERLRSMGPVGRFFSRYILCHDPTKDNNRKSEEDYRMRNVRRYLYNNAQSGNYGNEAGDGKHARHASVSSDNFSSSRSDSWRVQNRCGIPLRMIEPRRRNSWAVTRKPSQDSNLSSSRNDSSATSNSTATWRLSRSSVSSDAASHSGGGKSSFKRISTAPASTLGGTQAIVNASSILGAAVRPKVTMPTSTAAVAAAAAAAAVATGSAAGGDIGGVGAPLLPSPMSALTNNSDDDEMAALTMTNTIQNQNPAPIENPTDAAPKNVTNRKASLTGAVAAIVPGKARKTGKKKKKKKVKIKKPPKKEVTIIRPVSEGANPEIDDDEIDDEEASAKIATNRPRLVRQSAFFSDEVVIEPEVCPVHGPLNPGTYDDDEDPVSDLDDIDEDDDDEDEDDDEEDDDEATGGGGSQAVAEVDEEEEDVEDPTSPILRKGQQTPIAGIALVIVPRRLSTVRSRDDVDSQLPQQFIRQSTSSHSITGTSNNTNNNNNNSPSPTPGSPNPTSSISPNSGHGAQQTHSNASSPTALLLPAGMAHFGRRKMSEQPVKFYVVPATTGLLTSAKWHSMSCVDGSAQQPPNSSSSPGQQRPQGSPNYAQSSSPTSLRSQAQHSKSHSPRQFPRHEMMNIPTGGRRLSSSIVETAEEAPGGETMDPLQRPLLKEGFNEQRRVSFQLPGVNLKTSVSGSSSPPERIPPPPPPSEFPRRGSNS